MTSTTDVTGAGPATAALAAAERLAEAGRYRDAIDLVTHVNRQVRCGLLEEHLVQLRNRAFLARPSAPSRPDWPPNVPDLFPDCRGELVEITPDALTSLTLASAIVHHGALLVRGLIPDEQCAHIKGDIDRIFAVYRWLQSQPDLARGGPWYVPFESAGRTGLHPDARAFLEQTGGFATVDSPRALFNFLDVLEQHGLVRLIAEHLGEPPALSVSKATLRRHEPAAERAAWHQDGRFLDKGVGIRTVNLWLSLSHCGVDAPGIEMLPARIDRILETGTDGTAFEWTASERVVVEAARIHGGTVRPQFAPGDALFFDEFNVHRTAFEPGMTRARYAVESWFFAPSRYPPGDSALMI
jgi:hypothetical protein